MIGFYEKKENTDEYYNTLEPRDIRLIRGDLDLGYNNF
jgi:hypothetical protein